MHFKAISAKEAGNQGYRPLDFKPLILKRITLLFCLAFSITIFGAVVVVTVLAFQEGDQYYPKTSVRARAIQFTPSVLGSITNMLWTSITTEYCRLSPFFGISDKSPSDTHGTGQLRHHIPWQFRLATCLLITLVPLKSIFIWVDDSDGNWVVTIFPYMGIVLAVVYIFFVLLSIWIIRETFNEHTGLMYDPVSIADQLWICERMDMEKVRLKDYEERSFRLGYWEVSDMPEGARTEGCPTTEGEHDNGKSAAVGCPTPEGEHDRGNPAAEDRFAVFRYRFPLREFRIGLLPAKRDSPPRIRYGLRCIDLLDNPPDSGNDNFRTTYTRERFYQVPFWVSPLVLFGCSLLSLAAFVLLNVALGIKGWTDETNLISINAGNAAFQFATSLFGSLLLATDQNIDQFHRAVQPYAGMYKPGPPEQNLLLDYPGQLPVLVTITALRRRHYKVALASAMALLAQAYPVVLGGAYLGIPPSRSSNRPDSQGTYKSVLVLRAQPIYWIVYAFTFLHIVHPLAMVSWDRKRYLPGDCFTIIDTLRYCYASSLIREGTKNDRERRDGPDCPKDEHKDFKARLVERGERYQFGIYKDGNGKPHIGFDAEEKMCGLD